jgi:hypothetical protein
MPRFQEGPRWPGNSYGLGMSIPTNTGIKVIKDLPEDIKTLSKEERASYFERTVDREIIFTDLAFMRSVLDDPNVIAKKLFLEAGITEDALRGAIMERQTGDPDWWRKPPDLMGRLAKIRPGERGAFGSGRVYNDSAEFNARMRGAPKAEFEDLLLALLTEGTDTAAFFDARGISRDQLRQEVENVSPRFERGPLFPDSHFLVLAVGMGWKPFSDLLFVLEAFELAKRDGKFMTPGLKILVNYGITEEIVLNHLEGLGVRKGD